MYLNLLCLKLADRNPDLFTIKVHYGGTFHLNDIGLRVYEGGKLRIIDQICEDYFNMTDVNLIAVGAGYKFSDVVMYLWRVPLESLDNGLRPLQCDEDIVEFLYHASYYRFMEVYMDNTPLISICKLSLSRPITAKLVEIEEVDSDSSDEESEEEVALSPDVDPADVWPEYSDHSSDEESEEDNDNSDDEDFVVEQEDDDEVGMADDDELAEIEEWIAEQFVQPNTPERERNMQLVKCLVIWQVTWLMTWMLRWHQEWL